MNYYEYYHKFDNSNTVLLPLYFGIIKLYFSYNYNGINLPPMKCLPLYYLTPNFGNVNDIKYYGLK